MWRKGEDIEYFFGFVCVFLFLFFVICYLIFFRFFRFFLCVFKISLQWPTNAQSLLG
jgi:hypothetical protein